MKQGWQIKDFELCLDKTKTTTKLQSSLYGEQGVFPIVSQEKELISGYWDKEEDVFKHKTPIVVFGDHTKVVKYIDFDFVIGADGVKILSPKSFLNPKYLYYWVCSVQIPSHGYARHYRYLKEHQVPIPSLSEQQHIVTLLDAEFAKNDALKANAEKNLRNAKDLFQAALKKELEPKEGWKKVLLSNVCAITSSLVDPCLEEYQNLFHVGGANIISDKGVLINLKTAKEEELTSGKYCFDNTMVLYNKIRPYLKKVARPTFHGLCSADMYPLKPNENITKDFLYYVLISDEFTDYAIKGSARAGMPKVNREHLFAYECFIPDKAEQSLIATRLDALNEKCKTLQANYEKTLSLCDDLKQALLRKAFNGEI